MRGMYDSEYTQRVGRVRLHDAWFQPGHCERCGRSSGWRRAVNDGEIVCSSCQDELVQAERERLLHEVDLSGSVA
jgi:hypothetical protein